MHYGGGWALWGLMSIIGMVLFWVLLIVAIVALVRYLQRTARSESGSTRAEEVLAERFARGEIDEEEYRRRLETLVEHRRKR
ncbi:SHOCT domain-containing protein [Saccharopolyspora oryzae]|uniref:SHOCT domain-containing protein n=1 Tax=Saccharopolyspora oryzae TaxID=2997343 RepID=A0ABT4UU04_9PSEU|nr:SHOCT domain-containing protein [Saccharopolyspora oryzae]MDA3625178.1 SHOCT domain-containing protein [Saccharopolyspora oryzae]